MKRLPVILCIAAIALSIGCVIKHTSGDLPKFKVSGTVKVIRDYCGGAAPSDDQMNPSPWPTAGVKLYIRKSDTNDASAIVDSLVSGADGNFSIELEPGTYCVVEQWKKAKYSAPVNNDYTTYDEPCYRKRYMQCDYTLVVKQQMSSVEIVLHHHCAWTTPCQSYNGPLPPGAPPTNRGGNQPGHQE